MELETDCICRICLQELELQPLFDKDEDGLIIADKIMECFSLEIEQSENYPQKICDTCLSELNAAFRFRRNCENSSTLLSKLTKVKVAKEIVTDSVVRELADCTQPTEPITDSSPTVEQSQTVKSSSIPSSVDELYFCQVNEPDSETDPILPNIKLEDENQIKIKEEDEIELGSEVLQETSVTIDSSSIANNEILEINPELPWRCEHCDKFFKHEFQLMMHWRLHRIPFACSICGQEFALASVLRRHMKVHRIADNVSKSLYSCHFCDKKFSTDYDRTVHERLHSDNPIKCEICGKLFSKTYSLNRHISDVHTKLPVKKLHTCGECGKRFTSEIFFKRHLERLGHDEFSEAYTLKQQRNIDKVNQRSYSCHFCSKTFSHGYTRNTHERLHSNNPIKCEICEKTISNKYCLKRHILKFHTTSRLRKQHKCGKCGRLFKSESNLRLHLQRLGHHEIQKDKHGCGECGKGFENEQQLAVHKKLDHPPLTCSICGEEFPKAHNLSRHMAMHKSTGKEDKIEYSCNFCDKKFSAVYTLKMHERLHGNNPFKCKFCEKIVSNPSCLKRHILTCHTKNRKSNLTCHKCGVDFKTGASLRRHLRSLCPFSKEAEKSQNESMRSDGNDSSNQRSCDSQFYAPEQPVHQSQPRAVDALQPEHSSNQRFDVVAVAEDAEKGSIEGPSYSNDNDVYTYKIVFK